MDERAYREAERRLWESVGAEPRERTVHLARLGVRVRVQEVGEGEPVLYVHGGPNTGSAWAPIVGLLPGFRSIVVDRPGTGLSDPLPLGPDNLAEVTDAFVGDVLDALGVAQAHVVASSFGGFVALRSAAASPQRVGRMVQMACPAGAPGMRMPGFMRAMVTPGLGRVIRALPPNERAGRMILRQIGHGASLDADRIPQVFFDWYLAMQRHTATMTHESRLVAGVASPTGRWHEALSLPSELLARVTAPTHFLWGADDTFGGQDVAEPLVAAMPSATLEMLPDAGHLPWLDDPARAAATIEAHLRPPVTSEAARS